MNPHFILSFPAQTKFVCKSQHFNLENSNPTGSTFPKDIDVIAKRDPGSQGEPIDATFDITGWEDIAEENCRVMLCVLGGKRIL